MYILHFFALITDFFPSSIYSSFLFNVYKDDTHIDRPKS